MSEKKWRLSAYMPGQPRHIKERGGYRDTAVFAREYGTLLSLYRAAVQVHRRNPDATLEAQPYEWKGSYWCADTSDRETLYFCTCGGRLEWPDPDMAHCTRCGDEWARETIEARDEP